VQGFPGTSNIIRNFCDLPETMRHAIIYYLFLAVTLTFYGGQV
jgi:hypothetical protein